CTEVRYEQTTTANRVTAGDHGISYVDLLKRYDRAYPHAGYGGNFHRWARSGSRPHITRQEDADDDSDEDRLRGLRGRAGDRTAARGSPQASGGGQDRVGHGRSLLPIPRSATKTSGVPPGRRYRPSCLHGSPAVMPHARHHLAQPETGDIARC